MDEQKEITRWRSFRAKTKPLLQNLKGKMSGTKKAGLQRRLLDQRMSVSEPDMLQVVKSYNEGYSPSLVPSRAPNYYSSPSTPVKNADERSEEEILQEGAALSGEAGHPTNPLPDNEPSPPTGLPVSEMESSRNDEEIIPDLNLADALTEGKYVDELGEGTDLESSQSSMFFEEQALEQQEGKSSDLPSSRLPSYLLKIHLKEGHHLVVRDRCGTSDPYVKFKLAGKTLYKSKIVYKNLNPRWDETFVVPVKNLNQKLYVKVYDRDLATDDFMGSAYLNLNDLEINSAVQKELQLDDPNSLEDYMGEIILEIKLINKPCERKSSQVRKKRGATTKTSFIQNIRLSDSLRKNQLWNEIVGVTLFEGKGLEEKAAEQRYVRFRLGDEQYTSKALYKCANPQWRERFHLHLFNDRPNILEVEVCGKDSMKQEESFGVCTVDLLALPKEHVSHLDLPLVNGAGSVVLLVTFSACSGVCISDPSVSLLDDPTEKHQMIERYRLRNAFQDMSDIGFLQVQVIKACDLLAADFAGKSDPFCVLELGNDRLLTHTIYKNLNPKWNKVFSFNVRDIHDVLEVTVFDEDGDKPPDFLGKVAIPLLSIKNGQRTGYVLKNRKLGQAEKGVLYLQMDIISNPIKASLRTFKPKEPRKLDENSKFSKKVLTRNLRRVRNITRTLWSTARYIQSCFEWESTLRSLIAFMLYLAVVWTFEIYMLPLALLMILAWNYIQIARGKVVSHQYLEYEDVDGDDDEDDDEKDSERKGLLGKLHKVQDIVISVQNFLDTIASFGERLKNVFNWTVPFLGKLGCTVLAVCTIVLYFVPLRYLLLIWGIHKFTKKLRNPYAIDNNELLDFLSRVPSDVQKVQQAELRLSNGLAAVRKKKCTS
ncbi:multiple C2 and transmembrane domain-containing protein 2 [Amblyraja radiata]|uniref:multiple C2 and transmembrane domain-containing protein 2 n=1 Tax=Amblyraja radiata TaxID=386614 RepID=UPI0014030767|nr:multiple C2 and transmembrane domain-containing protein 2 [Amblyraja radiata]XP_032906600.1 multiple C2 and transmembrane domain-containing protein 2 [Amblyraja radiata]